MTKIEMEEKIKMYKETIRKKDLIIEANESIRAQYEDFILDMGGRIVEDFDEYTKEVIRSGSFNVQAFLSSPGNFYPCLRFS